MIRASKRFTSAGLTLECSSKTYEISSTPTERSSPSESWQRKRVAFVTYTTREGAEKAAEELSNKLVVNGQRLKISWGRPQVPRTDPDGGGGQQQGGGVVAHSGLLPRAVISHQERPFYPSMDPQRMGAVISSQDGGDNRGASSSSYPIPPHGHYQQHQPYPPQPYGGYMQQPYQHGPPQAAHLYPQQQQPGPGSRPNPPPTNSVSAPPPDSVSDPPLGSSSQQSAEAAVTGTS